MRLLHLIPHLSGGGAERQLSYLAPEMAKLGHEVHIAYLREGPESVPLPGVISHQLALSGNHDPMLFFKLFLLIRTIEPHIIQSWLPMMDVAAGLFSLNANSKWILSEPASESFYLGFNLKKKLRARLAQKASAIVCNSFGGKSYWLGQGIPNKRLFVIPNAVPLHLINGIKPMQNEGETRRALIYTGRLVPSKNVDVVINAIAQTGGIQNVRLYIAGDGPAKPYLMSLVERLKLWDAVSFLGFLPCRVLWARIKAADAFISLSAHEGMPNSVCEAIACGIPLILSDIPAHRAFLDDDSALLVQLDSAAEIAKGICRTLKNTQDASHRAKKALEAISCWTTEVIAAKYIELYERLL